MPIIKRVKPHLGGTQTAQPAPPSSGLHPGVEATSQGGVGETQEASSDFLAGLEWNGTTERRVQAPTRRVEDTHRLNEFKNAEAAYHTALENGRQEGFQQGYSEGYTEGERAGFETAQQTGYEAGYAEGMQEAQAASEAIWDIIRQLDSAKNLVLTEAMEDLVPMAMAIAQRILKTEVACDRNLVVALALDTLEKVDRTQKEVLFRVHPTDVATLRKHIQENDDIWLGEVKRNLIVSGDDTVDPGSCIAETSGGQIDARFKTQLNVIRGLLGLRKEQEPVASSESEFDHLLRVEES